jgi:hypothetical protein
MAKRAIPLLATGGLALTGGSILFGWGTCPGSAYADMMNGDFSAAVQDMRINAGKMENYIPLIAGTIGSILATKVGINRRLPKGINL